MTRNDVFWNRSGELAQIRAWLRKGGFGCLTGRRRIGKTALLKKVCEQEGGFYHQAVEGTPEQQLLHLAEEMRTVIPIFRDVVPRTWNEFFKLLSREKLPRLLVFDEFPYWVEGDPTLASFLQKWIDHSLPKLKTLVLASGSSQSMLDSEFLRASSPLYGRAAFRLRLKPMSYGWFCRALKYEVGDALSFTRFSLVSRRCTSLLEADAEGFGYSPGRGTVFRSFGDSGRRTTAVDPRRRNFRESSESDSRLDMAFISRIVRCGQRWVRREKKSWWSVTLHCNGSSSARPRIRAPADIGKVRWKLIVWHP